MIHAVPFDQPTRNALAKMVGDCRRLLTEDIRKQLQGIYGLQPDGTALSLEALGHLNEQGREIARELREWQHHLAANEVGSEPKRRAAAFERITREMSFTVLNRLAALRLCEERGHVIECVRRGMASDGFQLFERLGGGALGTRGETYRTFLDGMFDELALDLGVLFDRRDPRSLAFPDEQCLEQVLALLTAPALSHLWQEDETIGWIYQYFNDPAERKKMREQSAAPRNSHELAVRNQFFTPRYVVEFLTDNTLGRIWYEMTLGETRLNDQCRYLVRRPNEIFLKQGESAPTEDAKATERLSQEELLKQPVHVLHRVVKDPRTVLMLDPACGSMHFGLYAFDLFELIYDEAWELEQELGADALTRPPGMKSLHDTYAAKAPFLKDVPRLIVEHNIHGIDIDPRCAQIAGLSLWLRAQKAWQRHGLKPAERPAIKRSNIVCAEPMPGEKELLREFAEREFPAAECGVFMRLLEDVFDKMQLAGEAGSLLKIEEEIRSAIAEAKKIWTEGPKGEQAWLFPEAAPSEPKQMKLDLSAITDEQFWERAEDRIYAALRDYAEQAENGGGFQRRLFAQDTARGFAFIDVCRKRYDMVAMNPPFGEGTQRLKSLVETKYAVSKYDLGATFIDCMTGMLVPNGFVGALSNRTIYFLARLSEFRRLLLDGLTVTRFADLGSGVLDALVETAAACFGKNTAGDPGLFVRITQDEDKEAALRRAFESRDPHKLFVTEGAMFEGSPSREFCYWTPKSIQRLRSAKTTLSASGVEVRQGIATGDNFHFLRLLWEIPSENLFHLWHPYSKGGEYSPFYFSIHLCVKWNNSWRTFFNGHTTVFSCLVTRNSATYLNRPALSYPTRTSSRFAPRAMPAGTVFDTKGSAIFHENVRTKGDDPRPLVALLGILNSSVCQVVVDTYGGAAEDAARSYGEGVIERLPFDSHLFDGSPIVGSLRSLLYRLHGVASFDERVAHFAGLIPATTPSLTVWHQQTESHLRQVQYEFDRVCGEVDALLAKTLGLDEAGREFVTHEIDRYSKVTPDCLQGADLQGISHKWVSETLGCAFGRRDIRYATGEKATPELPDPFAPLPVCAPGLLRNAQGLPAGPHDVPALYPLLVPWDGILVDDPNHPLDIERRAREVIKIIWKEGSEAIDHEACELLGVKSLREYFRKPSGFFADHLKRYSKSRRQAPIYWPLSTTSGSYTLWIYYHRLTDQTLYACVNDFVQPKLNDLEREIPRLRDEKRTKELQVAVALQSELEEFKQELLAWAPRWKPNLNDGVLITACPLWKLFHLPKWRKDLEACWKELEAGDYDWAHVAYGFWPDRVRDKCTKDRSVAIAHELEDICEVESPKAKKGKNGRRSKNDAALQMDLSANEDSEA